MRSDFLGEHLSALIAFWALFAGGLVALCVLATRIKHQRTRVHGVRPWNIDPSEFLFFLVTLVLWMILSGALAHQLVSAWDDSGGPLAGILASYLMQFGMLAVFLRFSGVSAHAGGHLFSAPTALGEPVLLRSAVGYLAMIPVIVLLSALWITLLQGLAALGLPIELRPQDPVMMFAEVEETLPLVLLVALAAIVAPVAEELVFRAGIYRFLRGRVSMPVANLISAAVFASFHSNLQSFAGLLAIGIGLAAAYEITGNIRVPILIHALHNSLQVIILLSA